MTFGAPAPNVYAGARLPRPLAFPMRCHPQADAGDREAVDEENGLQFSYGCNFSWYIKGFA